MPDIKSFLMRLIVWMILLISPTYLYSKAMVASSYKEGVFYTNSKIAIKANDSISSYIIDRFVNDMCYNIDGLFQWGLKGMRLNNEDDNLLIFDFKQTSYNKKTRILRGTGDILVQNTKALSDLYIDSKLTQRKFSNGRKEVNLKIASPNMFLKDMNGTFRFIPHEGKRSAYFMLDTQVEFAWFFNIFITQERYKKILEWRIAKVLENLKDETEKMQLRLNKN